MEPTRKKTTNPYKEKRLDIEYLENLGIDPTIVDYSTLTSNTKGMPLRFEHMAYQTFLQSKGYGDFLQNYSLMLDSYGLDTDERRDVIQNLKNLGITQNEFLYSEEDNGSAKYGYKKPVDRYEMFPSGERAVYYADQTYDILPEDVFKKEIEEYGVERGVPSQKVLRESTPVSEMSPQNYTKSQQFFSKEKNQLKQKLQQEGLGYLFNF
jgi:hypothetical protein